LDFIFNTQINIITINEQTKMSLPTIQYIGTFDDANYWMGHKIIMSDSKKNITCKIENGLCLH
jgi:hypothetical protein